MTDTPPPQNDGTACPDLPEPLARRPIDPRRRLPIPVVNVHDDEVDFAALNGTTTLHTGRHRLCALDGEPLDYWIGFLGAPNSAAARVFTDPPMHPDCARAALRLCPYIARGAMRRRTTAEGFVPHGFGQTKPDTWVLYLTRDYTISLTTDGAVIFRPAPAKSLEHYDYDEHGRLHRRDSGGAR